MTAPLPPPPLPPSPLQIHSPQLMAALFGQVGIASMRAAVVDLVSMERRSSWSLRARKDPHHETADSAPDSAFIAASDAVTSLRDAPPAHTMVRKLSPRVWSFAWRSSTECMVIAEVRYHDRRDALEDTEITLVRLFFLSFSQVSKAEEGHPVSPLPELEWPAVDRRRGRDWRAQARSHRVVLTLLGLSALLALWLAGAALPAARNQTAAQLSEIARRQTMADKTINEHLSLALASGDYGEVQGQLTTLQALGYFERAAVVNTRQKVVASVGTGTEAVIGKPVLASLSNVAKPTPLLRGSSLVGQLLTLDKTAEESRGAFRGLWALALISFLASLGAAAVLLLRPHWRPRLKF